MAPHPQRITVHRVRGFDLQATSQRLNGRPAKMVTRPGRWGNPFEVAEVMARLDVDREAAQARAVALCRQWLDGTLDPELDPGKKPPSRERIIDELAGYNLACWCRPGEPCHADHLIELANPK